MTSSKVPIGTILEGKFRISREIGRGGMAAVYEAENIDIGKRVAVKILAAELITSRIVRERFLREARAAAAIRSPYICDVYDSGMFEDRPFLVMELLEGESLYDMMTRVRKIDVESTLRIATHTARGLSKAHESSVVHRDLKPENIFLTKDEEGRLLAKLVDFGLAKFYEPTGDDALSPRITREGALFGTPAYMSPEQAKGQGEVDHRADLWALGCIVYECLTGQTVWNIEQGVAMILAQIANSPIPRPSKLRPDLPPSFDTWFEKALDRDPSKRYQTARELSDALTEALAGKTSEPRIEAARAAVDEALGEDTTREAPEREPSSSRPDARAPSAISVEPPLARSGASKAISALLLLATVALGAYAVWLYVLHPPGKRAAAAAPARSVSPPAAPSAARREQRHEQPITAEETEAYALKLGEAQELFTRDAKQAIDVFQAAFRQGNMPAARSLLSHAAIAVEEGGGACRVTGIGRPRPFQLEAPASRPTMARTERGLVVSWVDNHLDPRERQAFTVLLDSSMRRKSLPIAVTPEAHNVRQPQLFGIDNRLVLVFWDETGKDPGVYVRLLDSEGKIQSPPRKLSSARKAAYPTLTAAPNGDVWAVWEEDFENAGADIVARRLGPELEPRGEAVRLTRLKQPRSASSEPRTPDATVAHGALQIVFAKYLGPKRVQIMHQSVALDDPLLAAGLPANPRKSKRREKDPEDEYLGVLRPASVPNGKKAEPHVTCTAQGCFIAWDDEKAGAVAAYVDHEKGPLWYREFSRKGSRPSVSKDDHSPVVAWFEDSRLRLAPLSRDGVGKPSTLSKVSGFQPNPDLTRGERPGQWYIAFRDFESAHLEAFTLRAECR